MEEGASPSVVDACGKGRGSSVVADGVVWELKELLIVWLWVVMAPPDIARLPMLLNDMLKVRRTTTVS